MALPVSREMLCYIYATKAADLPLPSIEQLKLPVTLDSILDSWGSGQQLPHLEIILLDLLFHILLPIQVLRPPSESLTYFEKVLLLILTRLSMFLEMPVRVLDFNQNSTIAADS